MKMRLVVGVGVALGLSGAVSACGSHNLASAVRPADPSSNSALGEGTCSSEPFTLDMGAKEVADLQRAMRNGIAIVAQDCAKGTFKILTNCSANGSYVYNGSTLDAETKSFTNADDLKASFTSPAFVASASADLKSGVSLAIQYTAAGTSDAPAGIRKSDLKGSCDGATHFIQSVLIGAYETKKTTSADVSGGGHVMGQGASGASSSAENASTKRGNQGACAGATQADTTMHPNCDVPIKLTLATLGSEPAEDGARASASNAAGAGEAPGKSSKHHHRRHASAPPPPISGVTYRTCKQGDVDGCTKACTDEHDGASCAILGFMYDKGKGVPANPEKAAAAYQLGCDAGSLDGCAGFGIALSKGEGVPRDDAKAVQVLGFGCSRNNARSCSGLGNRARIMGNKSEAVYYLTRACNLGYGRACFYASSYLLTAQGPSPMGFALAMRGCTGHDLRGCLLAAAFLGRGVGVAANPDAADRLGTMALDGLDSGCDAGDMEDCEVLGDWFAGWYLNPHRDKAKAVAYYKTACAGHQADACEEAKHPAPPHLPPPTQNVQLPPPPPPPPPPANFNRYGSSNRG